MLTRYLEDAIAAEKSFETQLNGFSQEAEDPTVQAMFRQHAEETKQQYTMLTQRLEELGGSTSAIKSFLAHLFNFAPKIAQIGHDTARAETQDLMMAYAVENAEVAMYESLAQAAQLAGDSRTEELARQIQQQEKQTAEKVWAQIAPGGSESDAGCSESSIVQSQAVERSPVQILLRALLLPESSVSDRSEGRRRCVRRPR